MTLQSFCTCQRCLIGIHAPLTLTKVSLYPPGCWFTGQCPSGALCHTREAKGQRPVRVGYHRTVRRTSVRGTGVNRRRATAHQQAAVPVVIVLVVLCANNVAHPCALSGSFWPVPAPARVCRGAAEGEEACPVSASPCARCHR